MRLARILTVAVLATTLSACKLDLDGNPAPTTTMYVVPPDLGDWVVSNVDSDTGIITCTRGAETRQVKEDNLFNAANNNVGGICP